MPKINVTEDLKSNLALTSFACAIGAGVFGSFTILGTIVHGTVGKNPYTPWIFSIFLIVVIVCDYFKDGTPNRKAVYSMILLPSCLTSGQGKAGSGIRDGIQWVNNGIDGHVRDWFFDSPSKLEHSPGAVTGLVFVLLVFPAVAFAHSFASRSKKAKAAAGRFGARRSGVNA